MKKLLIILSVLFFTVCAWADTAIQVDFLLSGYRHPTTDKVLSGGKVYSFLDGTSTLSALYTDKDQGGTATNPVILDSSGKAEVYGATIYKFEIYDSNDVLIETITGLTYEPGAGISTGTDPGDIVQLTDDGSGNGIFPYTILPGDAQYVRGASVKTGGYNILSTDNNSVIVLGIGATSDSTFVLPSVAVSDDNFVVHILNRSDHTLTVQPSDEDSIWNSGDGYGIKTNHHGSYCTLRYDHDSATWEPMQIGGGFWTVEGLDMLLLCRDLTIFDVDDYATSAITTDIAQNHLPTIVNGIRLGTISYNSFASLQLSGTDENITISSDDAWDFFDNITDTRVIFGRVRFDNTASASEYIISHYEDSTNVWRIFRNASGLLKMTKETSGVEDINMSSTTVMVLEDWYNFAVVKVGQEIGLYIGKGDTLSIEGYDNAWVADDLSGNLLIGQSGADTGYVDGRIQDIGFVMQNLLNGDPDAGLTDTILFPATFNLATGGK